jgi:hypothetical protein
LNIVPRFEGDLAALHASAYDLELTVIPALGAKVCSLQWCGREVLARNPRKPLRLAEYAAPYSDYDASGFDECFPTIGPCAYPAPPFAGVVAPDHGELWSIPWQVSGDDGSLYSHTAGVRFPYRFHRWIDIPAPGHIHLRYRLDNMSAHPLDGLWSAHPLLAIRPGMRIHLPDGVRVCVDWSKDGRLGDVLDEHPWPITHDTAGNEVNLSLILPQSAKIVDKLYTTRLQAGWCAVHDPSDGFFAAALFSPDQIPYVGLSINLGGWPTDARGYYNLGLEPCNGYPDRLDIAAERGACATLPAHGSLNWEWHLFVGQTDALMPALERLRGQL